MCYRHAQVVFEFACPSCGARNESYRLVCKECGAELPDCETPEECEEDGVEVIGAPEPPRAPHQAPPNPKLISGTGR